MSDRKSKEHIPSPPPPNGAPCCHKDSNSPAFQFTLQVFRYSYTGRLLLIEIPKTDVAEKRQSTGNTL